MQNNTLLLIKTFLKSTSSSNVLRFSQDKAKRRYAKNALIGQVFLYVLLMLYVALLSVGLAVAGQAKALPELCAILLVAMPFLFTLFKSNGYLFGFKEYDMLMAMPFSVRSIVAGKFWYMYIKSIPMYALISLTMLIGYAVGGYLTFLSCLMWLVMTVALPLIPMVIASALGAIIVKIGAVFKYKSIAQALFTIILVLPVFFSRFFIEGTLRDDQLEEVMQSLSEVLHGVSVYIPFAGWFSDAVNKGAFVPFLLVVAIAVAVYALFFFVISKFYRKMNSQLFVGANHKKFEFTEQKQRSMARAIAYKEFKRMMGSSTYLVNVCLGYIMVAILGVVILFVDAEVVVGAVLQGAPIEASVVFPGVLMLIYFFVGMEPTTCCSPSLEGKNYWIMQSLPISPQDDNKGKILFNLCLSIPFAVFATVAASVCFRVSVWDAITSVVAIVSLCVYSTILGLRSGLKHRRLDWENETEIIKQGMAVSLYIIPHLIVGILLMPLTVVVNYFIHNVPIIMLGITVIAWILTVIFWQGVKKYTR